MTISLPGTTIFPCHDFFFPKLPNGLKPAKLPQLIINSKLWISVLCLLCPQTSPAVVKEYPGQEPRAAWCSRTVSLRSSSRDLMPSDPRVTGSAPCCRWLTQERQTKTSNSSFFLGEDWRLALISLKYFEGRKIPSRKECVTSLRFILYFCSSCHSEFKLFGKQA